MPPTDRWSWRKAEWSRKRKAEGKCFCGQPTYGYSLCGKHLQAQRERMRLRRAA